jgi:hypothetical protein
MAVKVGQDALSFSQERDKGQTTDDLTTDIKSCIYGAPLIQVHN